MTREFLNTSPIVVVGPGRCGTSAMAGLLRELGIFMGERFFPPHKTNPYGHWEDLEFLRPNDDFAVKRRISETRWRSLIEEVVERRVALGIPWGWKDPRTCQLLPQYLQMLPGARFIRCRRSETAMIDSFMRAYGAHGWKEGMAKRVIGVREGHLDRFLPADRTLHIDFDELRRNRSAKIQAIAEFAQLDQLSPEQLDAAVEFIRPMPESTADSSVHS